MSIPIYIQKAQGNEWFGLLLKEVQKCEARGTYYDYDGSGGGSWEMNVK